MARRLASKRSQRRSPSTGEPSRRAIRLARSIYEHSLALQIRQLEKLENAVKQIRSDRRGISPLLADDAHELLSLESEGIGEVLDAKGALTRLDRVTVDDESLDWAETELLGAVDVASRLGIARSTLDNWRREGRILAFSRGVRNFVFPMAQFAGSKPLAGLAEVRRQFDGDEAAWEWLVARNRMTGDAAPLEWLGKGRKDAVLHAAEAALDFA